MFFQFITLLPCRQLKNSCSLFPPREIDLLWYKNLSCWRTNFFFWLFFKSATPGGRNGRLCFGKWMMTKFEYDGNIMPQQHCSVLLLSILGPKPLLHTHRDKHKNLHTVYVWVFSPIFEQRSWLALSLLSLLNTGMAFLLSHKSKSKRASPGKKLYIRSLSDNYPVSLLCYSPKS